jgi:hypothetical protein
MTGHGRHAHPHDEDGHQRHRDGEGDPGERHRVEQKLAGGEPREVYHEAEQVHLRADQQ